MKIVRLVALLIIIINAAFPGGQVQAVPGDVLDEQYSEENSSSNDKTNTIIEPEGDWGAGFRQISADDSVHLWDAIISRDQWHILNGSYSLIPARE
ncbi:MAG: hypothetical protein A2176_12415 [Spirochaetes bacterium RBG_13_51_14]|nr:MAG: hypothetical protein A2176_12415 [Spirochaetes bacterium RBG_13_51_14]